MKTVTIMRRWNNPRIEIMVSNEAIALTMTLEDFVRALTDEVAERVVVEAVQAAGNPTLLFTNAQLEKRLIAALEGEKAQQIFIEATDRIMEVVKQETVKLA